MSDKYGVDQAPDCYPGTNVLINLLGLRNADDLDEAERYLNEVAAMKLEFVLPPYSLATLKNVHHTLFEKIYAWAGETRTLAISKGMTRFCSPEFIEREVARNFLEWLMQAGSRDTLAIDWFHRWLNPTETSMLPIPSERATVVRNESFLNILFSTLATWSIGTPWTVRNGSKHAFNLFTAQTNLLPISLINASAHH